MDIGEFSGNKSFDAQAITDLRTAAQEFSKLPVSSAGQRVTDDSMNRPLDMLRARFSALVSEARDFNSRAAQLLSVLGKDAVLIEQILAAAETRSRSRARPDSKSRPGGTRKAGIHGQKIPCRGSRKRRYSRSRKSPWERVFSLVER